MKIEEKVKAQEDFYGECAKILGTEHEYRDRVPRPKLDRHTGKTYIPLTKQSRWAGREPGNGRFPGFGLIRLFGNTVHISLLKPKPINETIEGWPEALEFLRKAVNDE